MKELQKRLEDTEAQMAKILQAMQTVSTKMAGAETPQEVTKQVSHEDTEAQMAKILQAMQTALTKLASVKIPREVTKQVSNEDSAAEIARTLQAFRPCPLRCLVLKYCRRCLHM